MIGHSKARLWAIDIVNGEITIVRFIWQDQRELYVAQNRNARAIENIQQCGADMRLYDVTQGKEI